MEDESSEIDGNINSELDKRLLLSNIPTVTKKVIKNSLNEWNMKIDAVFKNDPND